MRASQSACRGSARTSARASSTSAHSTAIAHTTCARTGSGSARRGGHGQGASAPHRAHPPAQRALGVRGAGVAGGRSHVGVALLPPRVDGLVRRPRGAARRGAARTPSALPLRDSAQHARERRPPAAHVGQWLASLGAIHGVHARHAPRRRVRRERWRERPPLGRRDSHLSHARVRHAVRLRSAPSAGPPRERTGPAASASPPGRRGRGEGRAARTHHGEGGERPEHARAPPQRNPATPLLLRPTNKEPVPPARSAPRGAPPLRARRPGREAGSGRRAPRLRAKMCGSRASTSARPAPAPRGSSPGPLAPKGAWRARLARARSARAASCTPTAGRSPAARPARRARRRARRLRREPRAHRAAHRGRRPPSRGRRRSQAPLLLPPRAPARVPPAHLARPAAARERARPSRTAPPSLRRAAPRRAAPHAPQPLRCAALRCAALRCAALRCAALRCAALRGAGREWLQERGRPARRGG